jgi:hypothetical protein
MFACRALVGNDGFMYSGMARTRFPTLRLWLAVFLLVVLVLCGIHFFVSHHDGDSHGFETALAISLGLSAIVLSLAGDGPVFALGNCVAGNRVYPILRVPVPLSPGFLLPIRT